MGRGDFLALRWWIKTAEGTGTGDAKRGFAVGELATTDGQQEREQQREERKQVVFSHFALNTGSGPKVSRKDSGSGMKGFEAISGSTMQSAVALASSASSRVAAALNQPID